MMKQVLYLALIVALILSFSTNIFAGTLEKYSQPSRDIRQTPIYIQKVPQVDLEDRNQDKARIQQSKILTREKIIDLKILEAIETLKKQTPEDQKTWIQIYREKLEEARNKGDDDAVYYYSRLIRLSSIESD